MAVRAAALRITSPDGAVAGADLDAGPVTIGRRAVGHEPDVALDPDPQRWVGRVHCTLEIVGGMWTVCDNASLNGTLLRHGGAVTRLEGRRRIQHGDTILVPGGFAPDREPRYWELIFLDPHSTRPGPFGAPAEVVVPGPRLRYDWVGAVAYRCENGTETAVTDLRPKGHQLLRYMVSRSRGGAAVACAHAELITALWGEREEWPPHRSYTRSDLAGVVHAVRGALETDPAHPTVLETVAGIGYRLHVQPEPGAG